MSNTSHNISAMFSNHFMTHEEIPAGEYVLRTPSGMGKPHPTLKAPHHPSHPRGFNQRGTRTGDQRPAPEPEDKSEFDPIGGGPDRGDPQFFRTRPELKVPVQSASGRGPSSGETTHQSGITGGADAFDQTTRSHDVVSVNPGNPDVARSISQQVPLRPRVFHTFVPEAEPPPGATRNYVNEVQLARANYIRELNKYNVVLG